MVADDGTVMACEIAPLSDQLLQMYCTPGGPVCGELVAMVCVEPTSQVSTNGAAVGEPPSTETRRLAGLVVTVICEVATKFPVTDVAALGMWKLVLTLVVESNVPVPVVVQLSNRKLALGVAVTGTDALPAK